MDDQTFEILRWVVPGLLVPMGLMAIKELKELNHQITRMVEKSIWHEKQTEENTQQIKHNSDIIRNHETRIVVLERKP